MRTPILIVLGAGLAAGLGLSQAAADVSVNLKALDGLPGSGGTPPGKPAESHAPAHPAARHATPQHGGSHTNGHQSATRQSHSPATGAPAQTPTTSPGTPPATATRPPPPAATLPVKPPDTVNLAPPAVPPPIVNATPPKPPVTPDGGGDAEALGDGLRVKFAANRSDISPETEATLRRFAAGVPDAEGVALDLRAYAAGVPDDASVARRLSLSRALAVRTALLADGLPSTRIFVRALGSNTGDGPVDRVDVIVTKPPPPPAPNPPTAAVPPPAAARTAAGR